MTCPRYKCPECAKPKSPLANLPGWDIAERMVADDELRRAFEMQPKYTLPRDAEQLAGQVGDLAGELKRGAA